MNQTILNRLFSKGALLFKRRELPRVIPIRYELKILDDSHMSEREKITIGNFNQSTNLMIDDAILKHPEIFGPDNILLKELLPFRSIENDGRDWVIHMPNGGFEFQHCGGVETTYSADVLEKFLNMGRQMLVSHIANYQPVRPSEPKQNSRQLQNAA